jgi:hypothetical protein
VPCSPSSPVRIRPIPTSSRSARWSARRRSRRPVRAPYPALRRSAAPPPSPRRPPTSASPPPVRLPRSVRRTPAPPNPPRRWSSRPDAVRPTERPPPTRLGSLCDRARCRTGSDTRHDG